MDENRNGLEPERNAQPGTDNNVKMNQDSGNRKNRGFAKGFLAGVIIAALVVTLVFSVIPRAGVSYGKNQALLDRETERKVEALSSFIQENYYEDVDVEEIRNGLYQGLFDNLDVYSCYYTPEEYKELFETTLEGSYSGIGASLQQDEETMAVTIVHVYEGTPAEEAGLQEGDMIIRVDDYDTSSMELAEVVSHIRGEENTTVHLEFYRGSEKMSCDVSRRKMSLPTVESEMLSDGVGYISVSEFTDATTQQFSDTLAELSSEGMNSVIIDLRMNPGGVLTTACDMLDEILPEGLIVYTEDREGKKDEIYSTDEKSLDIPLVVLVNGYSASASEIFAGAIQDRGAGTIVGTTTYGKGVVQSVRSLDDGSAIKLTTHRYFTPGGTCIQGIGITPDVEIEYQFLGEEGEKYTHELDNQIQKAIEILKEKQ